MRSLCVSLFASLIVAVSAVAGCGPFDTIPQDEPPGSGRVCYTDADCVPNGCCGEGTGATHVQDAPDCRGVRCDGACPPEKIDCGCGIPLCRDSRCATAVSSSCL